MRALLRVVFTLTMLAACKPHGLPQPVPPAPVPAIGYQPPVTATVKSCQSDADCASGSACEGQGCTADQPGTCMPTKRMCTRDLRTFCGCDGQTFQASGSCPGRRYALQGACPGANH